MILEQAELLAVPCPYPGCNAPAGQFCVPAINYVHKPRWAAAEREAKVRAQAGRAA